MRPKLRRPVRGPLLGCRVVPGRIRMLRYWPGILGALLALVALLPGPVAADSSSDLRGQASALAQHNQDLATQSRGVVLQLYSLDSQLARERARLVDLRVGRAARSADRG